MWVVCEEHLERALDDFVDEKAAAPDLLTLDGMRQAKEPAAERFAVERCAYCHRTPKYVLMEIPASEEKGSDQPTGRSEWP